MRRVDWREEIIDGLIAQRPPFRFLSRIHAVDISNGFLHGSWGVDPDHILLTGHFPGEPIWPGACTIEGLAQACGALEALTRRADPAPAEGGARERAHGGVPGRPVIGGVEVRLLVPVYPGAKLEYRVWRIGEEGVLRTWRVEAAVGPVVVARGTLVGGRLGHRR